MRSPKRNPVDVTDKGKDVLTPEKLYSKLYGPYLVTKDNPYGTLEVTKEDGITFEVNRHKVKHYEEGLFQVLSATTFEDYSHYVSIKLKTLNNYVQVHARASPLGRLTSHSIESRDHHPKYSKE
ncbi:hypothetical protein CR513_14750, partial [Mucuna pruriens]